MGKNTVECNVGCQHKKFYDKADEILEKLPEAVEAIVAVLLLPVGIKEGALDEMFHGYKKRLKNIDEAASPVFSTKHSYDLSVIALGFLETLGGIMDKKNDIAIEIDEKAALDISGIPPLTGGEADA